MTQLSTRLVALFGIAAFGIACDRKPEDLPEWSARDHDNQKEAKSNQFDSTAPPKPGMPALEKYGINQVTLAAWKQNCVPCHGLIGAGDGPQGSMTRPTDLTNPKWHEVALDSEIENTIKKGRGRMPAFAQLPDETVTGLVRLIRLMNPERERDATASAPAAAPAPGAAPVAAPAPP